MPVVDYINLQLVFLGSIPNGCTRAAALGGEVKRLPHFHRLNGK
jgi:hypothetical protein